MSVNGTLVEAKMCTFNLESRHFILKKCPIYTHNGASVKFSTNSQEKDYSVDYTERRKTKRNKGKCANQNSFGSAKLPQREYITLRVPYLTRVHMHLCMTQI